MKVAELKAELTARNIPVKGMLKAALVSKLAQVVEARIGATDVCTVHETGAAPMDAR